jgi:FkbM family methyltransferase
MELSYAQNLEDYHLAQVFAGRPEGFYIDVGAGHPVADNVSFWFYLQGWRGVVVEPQKKLADLYAHVRPRDAAVCALIGAEAGEADFHEVDRLHGFSTTVEEHARGAAQFGAGYRTTRRPVTTLAALCEAQRVETIDFLKVDVEGAEAAVLKGADWSRWRPRVVVVEAIRPGTMAEAWQEWEPLLIAQRYRNAFFDGLNRFYVAEEEAGLADRFPTEKAPWNAVRHLYEFGRAPDNPQHPDHALARTLIEGFLANLPRLPTDILLDVLLRAQGDAAPGEPPSEKKLSDVRQMLGIDAPTDRSLLRETCRNALASDRIRAALGRVAACYDGGQLLDD